jgi:hypothetical protein
MNLAATAAHLKAVLQTYPDVPILLFWDRATWHGSAPDLNLQEHAWKAARTNGSHNHPFKQMLALADEFDDFLFSHAFPSSFLDVYSYNATRPLFI